jgi:hypothetical protein
MDTIVREICEESYMTLRGHIRNGKVVFEQALALPDGTAVEVDLRELGKTDAGPTLYERYRDIIGIAEGLPEDFSINHDHYIHGTPKRSEP